MRKAIITALVLGLVVGSFGAPAQAGKKKKKKAVATTLYLHGTSQFGEQDLPVTWSESKWHQMDTTKPTAAEAKSMFVTNYLRGPNTACSGNGLLPTWQGALAGTVKGTLTVTLYTKASPLSKINVELYPDALGGCNSATANDWVPPAVSQIVDVAPGDATTTVKFEKVNFSAVGSLVLQLSVPRTLAPDTPAVPPAYGGGRPIADPGQVRVYYDSASMAASVAFKCLPATGTSCTP